ncbi:PTH2-domain-containing protein [Flagelloscypha sp. PMI_526]|nr:PTH2-domain-containing protein [Flagelloscypha sp. PMI_526]
MMTSSSPTILYASLIFASLTLGYFAGSKQSVDVPLLKDDSEGNDSDGEDIADGDIAALSVEEECKMVLIVRTDLGMSAGKIAAQCSHATLACYKTMLKSNKRLLRQWEKNGQTKIALKCQDEEELLVMEAQAKSLNLVARSILDAGRTQIAAGSRTVLGIAGPVRLVNQVSGKLRLL